MSRSWTPTNQILNGSPAHREMRRGGSLSAGLRAGFENSNYQPKTVGLDRLGRNI